MPDALLQGKGAVIPAADGHFFAVTAGADLHILDREGTVIRSILCGQCADLIADPSGSGFIRTRLLKSKEWELPELANSHQSPHAPVPSLVLKSDVGIPAASLMLVRSGLEFS